MRQSNLYIIVYSAILTVLCGGLLALAAEGLKERQQANIAHEQKANILSTVMTLQETDNVEAIYEKRVKAFVIDYNGDVQPALTAKDIVVAVEYKKKPEERVLPVYEFKSDTDSTKVEAVVIAVYGYGLWNSIWGYVALKSDFNTVQGISFKHAGETPGLGARIESEEIQDRYKEKTIFENGSVLSIVMQKGEGKDYSKDNHKVDGMSSATLTAKGVNNMLMDYFTCYKNYLNKSQGK